MNIAFDRLFLAVCVLLSACQEEMSPLNSGQVIYRSAEGKPIERALSAGQLQALTLWLKHGDSNWRRCFITTPPSSSFTISLKHANGKNSFLRLLTFSNSKTTIEASYLDGSNLSEQPCALQTFSEKDVSDLKMILAIENDNG